MFIIIDLSFQYRAVTVDGAVAYAPTRGRKPRAKHPQARGAVVDSDSPFAKLKDLVSP